ncbi:MAG: class I SAM-dependent methyltransferase, partial [Gemmatimonadota bacterium]
EYQRNIVPGFLPAAAALCAFAGIQKGDRVLDLACGPGTASFAALDAGAAEVVGLDQAPGMIALAKELAAHRPGMTFLEGNLLALPTPDAAFDVVISSFGVIFATDPDRAVREMARVLRPRGRMGLLAWKREGVVARYYECIEHFIPSVDVHNPYDWGRVPWATERLLGAFENIQTQSLIVPFAATSPLDAWERLRVSTGRVALSYQTLSATSRLALDREMEKFFTELTRSDGSVDWPREAVMMKGVKVGEG